MEEHRWCADGWWQLIGTSKTNFFAYLCARQLIIHIDNPYYAHVQNGKILGKRMKNSLGREVPHHNYPYLLTIFEAVINLISSHKRVQQQSTVTLLVQQSLVINNSTSHGLKGEKLMISWDATKREQFQRKQPLRVGWRNICKLSWSLQESLTKSLGPVLFPN